MFHAVLRVCLLCGRRNAVVLSKSATQIDALGRTMREKEEEEEEVKRNLTTGIGLYYENEHRWF